jgi:tetratricopeptide (TPR) repeat protein
MTERVAVAPLVGRDDEEETIWLGASLSKLLTEHLAGAEMVVLDHNAIARTMVAQDRALPLSKTDAEALRRDLKLAALVHGSFTFDAEGRLLGLHLQVDRAGQPRAPLEISAPLASFGRFIERTALALIERLGMQVTDDIRRKVAAVPRPTNFDAYRQVVRARAAWARDEQVLALTQIESALAMEPGLEEAIEIALALALAANDTDMLRNTYRRWADLALGGSRAVVGAERLMAYGHWLAALGEWAPAQTVYEEALDVFRRERRQSGEMRALNHLANLALQRGQFQRAAETYQRTAQTLEAANAHRDAAIAWHNLALALRGLGETEEAADAVERALTLARQANQGALEARGYMLRGAISDDAGMWAAAQTDYQQAARILESAGDTFGLAMVKDQQAGLQRQQGNYRQSESLRLEALALLEQSGHAHEVAIVQLNLADLYFAMGNYAGAWDYASRAHQALEKMGSSIAAQAKTLVDTLNPLRSISSPPPPPSAPPTPGEGLYNESDLYNNEDEGVVMTGSDEDEE